MKKIIKYVLIALLIASAVWIAYYLISKSEKEVVFYETTSPEVRTIIKKSVATGTIVPENETEIRPQVSGIIDKIYVEPGAVINKGDLIAKVKIIPNMIQLSNATAEVEKTKINLENKKTIYERQKDLLDKEVISRVDYEASEVAYKLAQQNVETAENQLQIVKDGISKDASNATNTLIRSTISGMVLDVPVEEGYSVIEANTFNAGTPIAVVADMEKMIFEGKVDETEVGNIKVGMGLLLNVGAIEGEMFDAILTYIAPKGTDENGAVQFEIKADVTLKEGLFIRSGYSANADIVMDKRDSVLSIEEKDLLFEGDTTYVEIELDSMEFEKREVKLGLSDGIFTEVKSGVDADTKIKVQ